MNDKPAETGEERISAPVLRRDDDAPPVVSRHGWRYHHIGIPTNVIRPDERYLPDLKMHVSGFESSPYGIQWMRFDANSPFPEVVKSVPHVAFEVDDLEAALAGREILIPPNSPSGGVVVAMIIDNGAPIELMQFRSASSGHPRGSWHHSIRPPNPVVSC